MPTRQTSQLSRRSASKQKTTAPTGGDPDRQVNCADFIAGDQITHYDFAVDDLERLIDQVLAFLQAGAVFAPRGDQLRAADGNGEALVFYAGARELKRGVRREAMGATEASVNIRTREPTMR